MADARERKYDEGALKGQGGDCYMFRLDSDIVLDATMRGNVARFINHSCTPNCYSKVIEIDGHKHIIIFAQRDLEVTPAPLPPRSCARLPDCGVPRAGERGGHVRLQVPRREGEDRVPLRLRQVPRRHELECSAAREHAEATEQVASHTAQLRSGRWEKCVRVS